MLVIWGIAVGALLGWAFADFESWGFMLGGVVGLFGGLWLRSAIRSEVRHEIAAASEALTAQFGAAPAAVPAQPMPFEAAAVAAPEPVLPPAAAVAPEPTPWAPPREPAEPAEPGLLERGFAAARGWLFGGNTIVRVGLVILFVGLSFLARYAAMAGMFPIEFRLAMVGAAGIALLVIGFTRRTARPDFALALQGAGVAVIYLTIFGAARFYDIVPPSAALALMIVVAGLGCALALLQNSQGLAAASFAGGFAVPVLLGGEGSSVGLFGYYAVLNLAVLFIAQRRSWRIVNLIGFFATFGVATAWGVLRYTPAAYATSQAFLILFIVIYVAAAILHARNTPGRLGNVVDSTLLFGPALVGFGLQVGLVHHFQYGDAFSALGFAAVYIGLATFLARQAAPGNKLLVDAMIAIGVGFVTLAIPLALGARWTSSAWALEGAGAYWVGLRQGRWLPRLFGLALIGVAALVFLNTIGGNVAALPLLGPDTIGATLIAAALLAVSWWLRPGAATPKLLAIETASPNAAFVSGFLFWCLAMALEITRNVPPAVVGTPPVAAIAPNLQALGVMLGGVVGAGVATLVGRRLGWRVATWPGRVTLLPLAIVLMARMGDGDHVLHTPDWAFWLLAIAVHVGLLWANDHDEVAPPAGALSTASHVGSIWLAVLLVADCIWFGIDRADLWNTAWAAAVPLLSAVVVLVVLTLWAGKPGAGGWPRDRHASAYYGIAALPIAAGVYLAAIVAALTVAGDAAPLPYVPLFNPIELTLALAIGALVLWQRLITTAAPAGTALVTGRKAQVAIAALAFIIINTMWLRIAYHYLGAGWNPDSLLGSPVVQTGLSILWTLLALALMLVAHRRAGRTLWLTGAGLLGAVVVKLLLVDLSATGGGERIIAFIVVGVLMLVVGYFVPLPPRQPEEQPT